MRPRIARRTARTDSSGQRRHRPDYMLVVFSVVLLVIGLIVVYAISPGLAAGKHVSENYYVNKQIIAVLLGVVSFVLASHVPLAWWRRFQTPLIVAAAIAALAVRLFGEQVNGAYRWIQVGGLSFQAVELVKLALLIWLAAFLSDRMKQGELNDTQKTFKPLLIALILIGIVVAKLQSDLGSTGVLVAMMAAMCFVAGLPLKRVAMIVGIIGVGTVLLVSTSSYRRDRLLTYMHPERDCLNTGYQACQALIAVGSGGLIGKGLGHGAQAYGYLPEAANDSIFAIMAEKFGFVGIVLLLCLFMALFARIKNILERAPDSFSRLLIAGILAWLSTQAIINIGAMIGLLPLKGITLPFISYGGTSVVFVTAAIGLVFQVSRFTTFGVATEIEGEKYASTIDWRRDRRPHYAYSGRRP
ncbi:MAG TPA: putative lipid II flippase FtsW [Candidatus Limnocylindrales bacterium]|nr:putative lipid II flippase FtsW [Candidatus Limnocylindrales bacterium]